MVQEHAGFKIMGPIEDAADEGAAGEALLSAGAGAPPVWGSPVGSGMALEAVLGTDHTYNGTTISGTAGEDTAFGDLVYRKTADGKWWKTDADFDALTRPMLAMVTETIDANNSGTLLLLGFIRDDDWTLTDGEPVFVSVTPGVISSTAPVAAGDFVRKIGFACGATQHILYFNPDATVLEIV